jgi:putative effector of murein hydrolase
LDKALKKKNILLIAITLILYLINQYIKTKISYETIRWYLNCYFNDTIGGITFIAYCNIMFELYRKPITKLWKIELLLLGCGIFWEYITPLYRHNTVSDKWDVVAYMVGGVIYWILIKDFRREAK